MTDATELNYQRNGLGRRISFSMHTEPTERVVDEKVLLARFLDQRVKMTPNEFECALKLAVSLESLSCGIMPVEASVYGEEDFDINDKDDCQRAMKYLLSITNYTRLFMIYYNVLKML